MAGGVGRPVGIVITHPTHLQARRSRATAAPATMHPAQHSHRRVSGGTSHPSSQPPSTASSLVSRLSGIANKARTGQANQATSGMARPRIHSCILAAAQRPMAIQACSQSLKAGLSQVRRKPTASHLSPGDTSVTSTTSSARTRQVKSPTTARADTRLSTCQATHPHKPSTKTATTIGNGMAGTPTTMTPRAPVHPAGPSR